MLKESAGGVLDIREAYLTQAFQVASFKFSEDGP